MLRLMAPFLSFTAEEAWASLGQTRSIFFETYADLPAPDAALLAKWGRIRELRDLVNKEIEALRAKGEVGSSLQAVITLTAPAEDHALLASLGADIKFVFITSAVTLHAGTSWAVAVAASSATKCARCWHYTDDVGQPSEDPTLCGRCVSNVHGAGESRTVA